jgi:hypothetical protein
LATISKLRKQLSVETDVAGGGVKLLAHLVNTTTTTKNNNNNHSVGSSPTTKASSTNPFDDDDDDDRDNDDEGKSQLDHEISSSTSKSIRSQSSGKL